MASSKNNPSSLWRLGAVAMATLLVGGAATAAQPTEWVKGRVIVETRAGLSADELAKIVAPHGGKARRMGGSNLHIIELPGQASETAVAQQLARNPHLKFAELDGLSKPSLVSNDPYLGSEWHLTKIGAMAAWDIGQGSGVTVAILDTGVDASHPDLASRIVPGWNFYSNLSDTSDVYNHGTGVAGTAAAITNNGAGVAGMAGLARIMPLKVSADTGSASWSAMAQALTYAADHGVRVANISYMVGGVASVQSAAQYMKNKGGLVFVAAGNTGTASVDLASTSLITVAATDANDQRASWSTYGPYVSLAAPGVGLYTTTKGGGYVSESGTSFSSPLAAGVAAAVMSANPALTSTQVEQILFSTATDLGPVGRDVSFGYGRVNAAAAVQAALATPAADTQAPTVGIASPAASGTVSGLVVVSINSADNVGVARVDLKVNGTLLASDTTAPFGFSWDSTKLPNGMASLTAVAYDAAGNSASSSTVSVNVANAVAADTVAPVVAIANPVNGSKVSGIVAITASASDNAGVTGITQALYIDGAKVASATGGKLSYSWNTRKAAVGTHAVKVVAVDAAGNSGTASVSVSK